jgi:hypothetical protein
MQLMGAWPVLVAGILLLMLSGTVYHFVFLKAAREGWPVVSHLCAPSCASRSRSASAYMRDSVDAMAQKVGRCRPSWSSWSP